MGRLLVVFFVVFLGLFIWSRARTRARKNADTTPELHKHPERLDQNLDSSDDA